MKARETQSMGKYILALRAGHNAGAAISDADTIRFAIQEERLTGEKNYWGFPARSIHACLEAVGAGPEDLAAVVSGGIRVSVRYHNRDDVLQSAHLHSTFLGRLRQRWLMPLAVRLLPKYGHDRLRALLAEEGLGTVPLEFIDHHTAHAATAYYGLRTGPEGQHLVLTCDGSGDTLCATVRVMGGGAAPRILAVTDMAHSLGSLWAWTTYALGFVPFEHEYKLMGMAPYVGEKAAAEYAQLFHRYLGLDASGLRFQRKISEPLSNFSDRLFRDLKGKRFDYLCAGLQRFTEEILCTWVRNAVRVSGIGDVLVAGGVFMNVKANQAIAALPEVERFEAFPSCGDETLPLGALYLAMAERFGEREVRPLSHFYLGDDLDPEATAQAVQGASSEGLRVQHLPDPQAMAAAVVDLLVGGKPVARCAGPMEYGARALGNRSILADPADSEVVPVINHMVKKRDFWMPFAPMVLEDRQGPYVVNPKGLRSSYMMMAFDTTERYRDLIAAVHNADHTCRAQILPRGHNPGMEAILDRFEAQTGRPVVLNTSFNLHGFPIVRTAEEALAVLRDSGLEHLQVGEFLVSKP
jgi:carbamoyltransferase